MLFRRSKSKPPREFVPCPHCGADIDVTATFCRHCGSSDADGWKEDWDDDENDDEFDYEQFVQREFSPQVTNTATPVLWRITSVILLIVFAVFFYNLATRIF